MKSPLVLILLATISLAIGDEKKPLEIEGATAEVFKTTPQGDLLIHRIDPPGYDPEKEKRPGLVLFFGGGWVSGQPTHLEPQGRYFAKRGMVVFLPDYRTRSRHETSPRECVADGKSAIRWVRANAERLGVDSHRIAAGGGSAGGHVAAAAGICDGFDEPDEDNSVSSRPNALVLFNPVYNNGPGGYGHDRAKEWFPAISPAHNLDSEDPPAIVFLGTKDKLIPVEQAEEFREKQSELGTRSELHLYEGEPHGFFNLRIGRGKPEHFLDTVTKADQFLTELGFLKGAPDDEALQKIATGEKS